MVDTGTPAIDDAARRQLAIDLFNHVWTLIGTPDRTREQDTEMIHAAHASRHHWGRGGHARQLRARRWQVSRVYSVLGRGEPALVHARLCLDTCVEHGIGDFDIAYAHEAMARAYRLLGDEAESTAHAEEARRASAGIADPEHREHAMEDIAELL
jgi:lipopolysaccharide biosynthesis protein